jgi:hypothetical protein
LGECSRPVSVCVHAERSRRSRAGDQLELAELERSRPLGDEGGDDWLLVGAAAEDSRRRLAEVGVAPLPQPRDGESYKIAYHLFSEDDERKIMIALLRYLDTFAKIDGSWHFAERKLLLDWSETRPSTPGTT